jgi:hypothetical protein
LVNVKINVLGKRGNHARKQLASGRIFIKVLEAKRSQIFYKMIYRYVYKDVNKVVLKNLMIIFHVEEEM